MFKIKGVEEHTRRLEKGRKEGKDVRVEKGGEGSGIAIQSRVDNEEREAVTNNIETVEKERSGCSERMGGLGGARCPQGGDRPHGGLDTFPPVPPSTGLGESPQNSEVERENSVRKVEERNREIETEFRETERTERIERKKRKEQEWRVKNSKVTDLEVTTPISIIVDRNK